MRRQHTIAALRASTTMLAFFVAVTTTAVSTAEGPALLSGPDRRSAPVFHAADILRREVLKGPNYEIEDTVPVRNHRYVFGIRTPWGKFTADGLHMLRLRLDEIRAIERARAMSRDPQFVDGLLESVLKTPRGVGTLLTDPVGSVLSVPRGLKRVVSAKAHPDDRRAGGVTRRRIAYKIRCDPETSNPVLKVLLDNLATRKGLGQLAGKVGMSAAVPGLGLVPLTAEMRETVAVKLPHEINEDIDAALAELGVDRKTRKRFLSTEHFTTLERLAYLQHLKPLAGIAGAEDLVVLTARAQSEADALARIDELRMLGKLHEERSIARIRLAGVPTAVCEDGSRIGVWSADYIVPQSTVIALAAVYRTGDGMPPFTLHCSGRLAPRARRTLKAADVGVAELQ